MNNSNSTIRTRTIWKAILLTVLPMMLSGLAVYLLFSKGESLESESYKHLLEEKDILLREKEKWMVNRDAFIGLKEEVDSLFKKYRDLNNDINKDSNNEVVLMEEMKNIKTEIEQKLNSFRVTMVSDTLFKDVYQAAWTDFKLSLGYYDSKIATEEDLWECLENGNDGERLLEQLERCNSEKQNWQNQYMALLANCNGGSNKNSKKERPPCYEERYKNCYVDVKSDYMEFLTKELAESKLMIITDSRGRERRTFAGTLKTKVKQELEKLRVYACQ